MKILFFSFILTLLFSIYAASYTKEISYDIGEIGATTVIGLFTGDGKTYVEGNTFFIEDIRDIKSPKIRVLMRIGSDIKAVKETEPPKIFAIVNGINVIVPFDNVKRDSWEWVDISIPENFLITGDNYVEFNSNILNTGNVTSQTVDISGSTKGIIRNKSYAKVSSSKATICKDRNWNIRLLFDYAGEKIDYSLIKKLEIFPSKITLGAGEYGAFRLIATLKNGTKKIVEDSINWTSSEGGIIYSNGSFASEKLGTYKITAKLGDLKVVNAESKVILKIPSFVEEPTSKERFTDVFPKSHTSLIGYWDFIKDVENTGERDSWFANPEKAGNWSKIYVPGSWQAQGFGLDYHGIGWYKTTFKTPKDIKEKRTFLNFQAVATFAKVYVNGKLAGEHKDNWSPFQIDITNFINKSGTNSLVVKVEELPAFVSAGFPLVVSKHFGGIWQGVSLYTTNKSYIDDIWVYPVLSSDSGIEIENTILGSDDFEIKYKILSPNGKEISNIKTTSTKTFIAIKNPEIWDTNSPNLYTLVTEVYDNNGQLSDTKTMKFGMRDVKVENTEIMLNGKPIYIRGMLHWGYYPHLISTVPSEETIRAEFKALRDSGFNLVKVCLFMMPERYYEIADEMGMLIWQEYPTWQSFPQKTDSGPFDELYNMYIDWVKMDRNHPSVIIRDLTCESHNTLPDFAEKMFDKVKEMTKSPLLEDNSSYLNNVKNDFWDWHIYTELNNQYALLENHLIPPIKKDPKPYMSGEDIDCDTYRNTDAILAKYSNNDDKIAWWIDNPIFNNQLAFEEEISKIYGKDFKNTLIERQLKRAKLVKKMTIESMRIYDELNGYVMCSMHDNILTRPGFVDDLAMPKWSSDQWKKFNNEDIFVAIPSKWSFSYESGEIAKIDIKLSNFGEDVKDKIAYWELTSGETVLASGKKVVNAKAGKLDDTFSIEYTVPQIEKSMVCDLKVSMEDISNSWNVYLFPATDISDKALVYSDNLELSSMFKEKYVPENNSDKIIVTDKLDEVIKTALDKKVTVIYIATDNADETIPRVNSAFWREVNHYLPENSKIMGDFPISNYTVGTQFMPMTTNRPFNLSNMNIDPTVWGINCRFTSIEPVTYIFESTSKNGKIIGISYKLTGEENISGKYLLNEIIKYSQSNNFLPKGNISL